MHLYMHMKFQFSFFGKCSNILCYMSISTENDTESHTHIKNNNSEYKTHPNTQLHFRKFNLFNNPSISRIRYPFDSAFSTLFLWSRLWRA